MCLNDVCVDNTNDKTHLNDKYPFNKGIWVSFIVPRKKNTVIGTIKSNIIRISCENMSMLTQRYCIIQKETEKSIRMTAAMVQRYPNLKMQSASETDSLKTHYAKIAKHFHSFF